MKKKSYIIDNKLLMSEWDYEKNKNLEISKITENSKKFAYWKCSKCGYKWKACIGNRAKNHTGCPACANKILIVGVNDLATTNPEVAKEWNYKKNYPLTPQNIRKGTHKKFWWTCSSCNYEYKASPNHRTTHDSKCPKCLGAKAIVGITDLATTYPEIAKEWHPTKNKNLKPTDIKAGSPKKVWWKCSICNYEWETSTYHRVYINSECPACTKKAVVMGVNDLATLYPEIAKEWHPTKNSTHIPKDVSLGSRKKFWWQCQKCNYEWEISVRQRIKTKFGCPKCSGRLLIPGINDLATTHPEITEEWDYEKNYPLIPAQIKASSKKKVWWKCTNRNHTWQAAIRERAVVGNGCPKCSSGRQTSFPEQTIFFYIKKLYPDAINRYKTDFLGKMELDIFIPSINYAIEYDGEPWHRGNKKETEKRKYIKCQRNNIKLIRIREKLSPLGLNYADYEYSTDKIYKDQNLENIIRRVLAHLDFSCRFFKHPIDVNIERDRIKILDAYRSKQKQNSLAVTHPEIAKEWHPTKNGNLTPDKFTKGTNYRAWWKCSKCGYDWQTIISHRVASKSGCPKCKGKKVILGGNDLASLHPEIAKEWHPTKNGDLTPNKFMKSSGYKAWWKCSKCGHDWQTSINHRVASKSGCPKCRGTIAIPGVNDLLTTHPEIAKEWHPTKNGTIKFTGVKSGSHKVVWWKCSKCGYEFKSEIRKYVNEHKCVNCERKKEKQIYLFDI